MRYICILVILASTVCIACAPKDPIYIAGTYRGLAEGYHSNLVVDVTTDAYRITGIEIVEEDETPIIAEIVYEEIPKAVMKSNSTNVDVVAGATYTSRTLLEAIENGLKKARKDTGTSSDEER